MKKKVLALTLSLAMVVSMAGCGNEKDNEPTPTPSNSGTQATPEPTKGADDSKTPETTPEPEATQEPEATPAPAYDFGGRTVRIGSYYDMTPDPDGNIFAQAFSKRIQYVEDTYNCNIEFVNVGGDYVGAYVTSVLSGDPVCDVGYILSYKLLPALIEGGIAYPISDLGVVDFSKIWYNQPSIEAGTYKGKTYTMGMANADVQYGIFWNKTLFERYNLPDLYELYDNGEWTWAKFKEIALAGNQDTDGDGEIDIHGFNQRENLVWSFMSSNNANAVKKTSAGVDLALDGKEATEALEFYADFMQNVPHLKGWLGDWQSQIWSFRDGQSMMCYEAWWISYGYLKDMQDEWGFVPFPKGPSATEYVSYGKEASPYMMLNGIDNPEEVATIIDLIFQIFETDEDWEDAIYAKFESEANDAKAVDICMELMPKVQISPLMGFDSLNKLINGMLDSISDGSNTPQSALEANQSALDAEIEDIQNHDYSADMTDYLKTDDEEGGEAAQ